MDKIFPHGFDDDKPINEILKSYAGVDMEGKSVQDVFSLLATSYAYKYARLQATYGVYTSQHLKIKYKYLLNRMFDYFKTKDEKKQIIQDEFWQFAQIEIVREKTERYKPNKNT
ncbi:hypothetical protein BH23THE1_BH23THE1_34530 [soil metagenome]